MPVDLERRGPVALITLNRPEVLNAMSTEALDRLDAHLEAIEDDSEVRVVVLTGAGKAFCAGADVAQFRDASPTWIRDFAERGQAVTRRMEDLRVPVIGAINGFALGGGCEIALACDVRLVSDQAKLGLPEVRLGIMPGWGGTQRLARLTNTAFAKEAIFTGRMIDAAEARERGLANRVCPADDLTDAALELASEIAERAPLGVSASKAAINLALEGDQRTHLAREADAFVEVFATEDAAEGVAAFLDKRAPRFSGSPIR